MIAVDGIKERACSRKTWWDGVREDMKRFGLSRENAQDQNRWRRKSKGRATN